VNGMLELRNKYEYNDPDNIFNEHDDESYTGMTSGARVSLGLSRYAELVGKASVGDTWKLGMKLNIPLNKENTYLAIMPTVVHFKGEYSYAPWNKSYWGYEHYTSKGFELPLIFSTKPHDHIAFTAILNPGFHPIKYTYSYTDTYGGEQTEYFFKDQSDILSVGMGMNCSLFSKYFNITPAAGLTYVTDMNGKQGSVFNLGLDLGFQMYLMQPQDKGK
jgi:hypothetical protein